MMSVVADQVAERQAQDLATSQFVDTSTWPGETACISGAPAGSFATAMAGVLTFYATESRERSLECLANRFDDVQSTVAMLPHDGGRS